MLQVERVQPNSSSGVSDQASGMQRYTVIRQGFFFKSVAFCETAESNQCKD